MGNFTFSSLARINDYRNDLIKTANEQQSKATPVSPISSQIPTGSVDARTEQALNLSGLNPSGAKNETSISPLFANAESPSPQFTAPDLDFTYNLTSIKGILAYQDVLRARSAEATTPEADQTLSESS
ncbi:hypothetical protein MLD52_08275 [Puniceicoccaceae bacterium K14]|nr:hypothetical protein [Puniceicoccaceae bacterium K14]